MLRTIGPFTYICLCLAVLSASQNILSPNLSSVAAEFGYIGTRGRDTYFGSYLSLAFSVISVPAGVMMGLFTDRQSTNRIRYLAHCTAIGGLAVGFGGLATEYKQLFSSRLISGMMHAAAAPLAFSMVADLFIPEARPNACAMVAAAMAGGTLFGQMFAGVITPNELWRNSFIFCGVVSCICAVLTYTAVTEPKRGAKDMAATLPESTAAVAVGANKTTSSRAFCVPTNLLLFVQALPNSIPWGVLSVYLIDFLSQERGYTVQSATMLVGIFGGGAAIGGISGAYFGGLLYKWRPSHLPIFMGITVALAGAALRALLMKNHSMAVAGVLVGFAGACAAVNGTNIRTIILNVTEAGARGRVIGVFNTANNLGRGLGPLILDSFANAYHLERGNAITICLLLWWLCGAIIGACSLTIESDEKMVLKHQRRAVV